MKKQMTGIAGLLFIAMLSACGSPVTPQNTTDKVQVIATLFPQYDFAREIAKEKAEIVLLLPPGIEAHSFEPTPKDITDIGKADVFLYTGDLMEPWASKMIVGTAAKSVVVVDTSVGIELVNAEEHDEHEGEKDKEPAKEPEDVHSDEGKDPHIWLNPVYAQVMVDNIVAGLIQADPANAAYYQANGEAYKEKLKDLDNRFATAMSKVDHRIIIYGGHFAFGYLARRYELEHISPYNGFAPDAEPTPQRIAELFDTLKETGMDTIYFEELVDPKVSRVISEQTGAKMVLLHGAHNLSKDELKSGITYLSIMNDNLEKLKTGLGYQE